MRLGFQQNPLDLTWAWGLGFQQNPLDLTFFEVLSIKMSSVDRVRAQVPANKLYINTASIASTIYTEAGAVASWVTGVTQLANAGQAILRDMGKTVYLPDNTTSAAGPFQSTILRKVQMVVPSQPGGMADNSGAGTYYTGYIRMGGQTYAGADAAATAVARLN
jgi:hypothetical protein